MHRILLGLVAMTLVLAHGSSIRAQTKPANDAATKARLTLIAQQFSNGADALAKAGLDSQNQSLRTLSRSMTDRLTTQGMITPQQLALMKTLKGQFTQSAKMWEGAERKDRADALIKQAGVLDEAIKFCQTLMPADPATKPAEPGKAPLAAAGADAIPALSVHLRMDVRPATPPSGAGAVPPGATGPLPPGAIPPPMVVNPTPGTAGPKVLTVFFQELNQTFYDTPTLGAFLQSNAAKLQNTPITFYVAADMPWQNVVQAINLFSSAPLTGEMKFSELKMRQGSGTALTVSPTTAPTADAAAPGATPTPAITPAPPAAVVNPIPAPAAGAGAAVPDVPTTDAGRLPKAVEEMIKGKTKVLFALDVSNENFPAARQIVIRSLPLIQGQFAVIALNTKGAATDVVAWSSTDALGRQAAAAPLAAHVAPAGSTNFTSTITAVSGKQTNDVATIIFTEGPRLPTGGNLMSSAMSLFNPIGKKSIFLIDSPADEGAVTQLRDSIGPSNGSLVIISSKQLHTIADQK